MSGDTPAGQSDVGVFLFFLCPSMKPSIMAYLKIEFEYRDASNYKDSFDVTIDTKQFPKANKLKVGDEVKMGKFGTPTKPDFFGGEIHFYPYNSDYDHNSLCVRGITEVEEMLIEH